MVDRRGTLRLISLGGIIAVAADFLLWPSWEPERLGQDARAAIGAHGVYAECDLGAARTRGIAAAVETTRRAAGVASNSLEATISRALTEPGPTGRDRLEAALVIDAALRRCAGRLSAMQLDTGLPATLSLDGMSAWRDWISGTMQALANGETMLPPRPATAEVELAGTDRPTDRTDGRSHDAAAGVTGRMTL